MNKRIVSIIIAVMFCLISPIASSESSQNFTADNTAPTMSTGDYFNYDLDIGGLLLSMESESENIIDVQENSNAGMRMEYGGTSCLQTEWTDCYVLLMTSELNLTVVLSSDSGIDNDRMVMLMRDESTIVNSGLQSQDTMVSTMDVWYTIDGEPYHSETIGTEITTRIAENEEPESIKVGDTWTVRESTETIINEKTRMNDGPWEHEDEEVESETTTTNYNAEVLSNVYVGEIMHETLKVKFEEVGSDESGFGYLTASGMPVKMEYYEEGNLQMIATLDDYKWTNEPSLSGTGESNEGDLIGELPGFTILPTLAVSILALFIVKRNQ